MIMTRDTSIVQYFFLQYTVYEMSSRAACDSVSTGGSLSGDILLFRSGRGLMNSKGFWFCIWFGGGRARRICSP